MQKMPGHQRYSSRGSSPLLLGGRYPGAIARLPWVVHSRAAGRWIGVAIFILAMITAFLFFADSFSIHLTYKGAGRAPFPVLVPPSRDELGVGGVNTMPVHGFEKQGHEARPLDAGKGHGKVANKRPEVYHSDIGRIVVTGGGGNLGKHMVRRLLATSTPVTVLDVMFKQDELDDIYASFPGARERDLLHVVYGDIRNVSALHEVISDDVVGVVHLAAVSRVLWCLENGPDCLDVNERGTQLILDALTAHGKRRSIKPWFILASSREVYGNAASFPVTEDAERKPANVYGASKLKAEHVLETHLERLDKGGKKEGSMHAIALRLSNVYGGEFDHLERLIPSIATQALSHLPIQLVGGTQNLDMLHIDDCIDAFLLAINRLSTSVSGNRFTTPRTSLEAFNVANGKNVPAHDLVDKLLHFARSKSPIQHVKGDDRFPDEYVGSTDKAERVLGYRAQVSINEGLMRFVRLFLQRTQRFLSHEIDSQCYDNSPNLRINTHLEKLDDCSVHVSVDVRGRLAALTPQNNGFAVKESFPGAPFWSTVKRSQDGKFLIRLRDWHWPFLYMGLRPENINEPGTVHYGLSDGEQNQAEVFWELEVNPELAAVKLILPGSDYQLTAPNYFDGNMSWAPKDADIWPFKITPICCPAAAPWPFANEDPVDHSIDFLRTSTLPQFSASIPKATCERMSRSLNKVKRDLATLSLDLLDGRNGLKTRLGGSSDWSNAQLPMCTNRCDHPTVCIDTGDCQCQLSACPTTGRFPFSAFANLPALSYPPVDPSVIHPDHDNHNTLVEMVNRSSWLNVLRPQASRYIGTNEPWPKIHVAGYAPSLQTWLDQDGQDVAKLSEQHCFSADSSMEYALREINVPQAEAEMVFMPYYQNRATWLWGDEWSFLRSTIPKLNPRNVVVPFTHDYGACLEWEWDVWRARRKFGRSPDTRDITAWSVMADVNGPCFNPLQDVAIPPRTCASPQLYQAFGDMTHVRPARQRKVLGTFKGSYWGTGANTRRKLNCEKRLRAPEDAVEPKLESPNRLITVWDNLGDYDSYMSILNDTIFCPLPEGITGWATRLEDVIYAGCIPVFIGHSSQYPFFDMLDWGKLSITVERKDLQRMEDVLMGYTMEEVERLQANMMLVRDAFLYPLDGRHADQLEMRGPLFFAMHSTKMRMLTQYPSLMLVDRPDWTDGRSA